MKPNFFDRPYPIPKFKSKHHYKIWWEMDEIYHAIYLWPHDKKKFEEEFRKILNKHNIAIPV